MLFRSQGSQGSANGSQGPTGAGPYTNQGTFTIAGPPGGTTFPYTFSTNDVFNLSLAGVYQITMFCYSNTAYFFATVGVYKTSSGFQSVFMGVTSYQLTLNLTSGPTISATVTVTGNVSGKFYWSISLGASYPTPTIGGFT